MNKAAARKQYIAMRNELSAEQIQADSRAIAESFIASDLWRGCKVIHIFISIPNKSEIDTSFLIDFFLKYHSEIKICTSVVDADGENLIHTYVTAQTTYLPNKWNIPEPVERNALNDKEIDLVLLPLLAFDAKGNRVGYGKGFYDRFLRKCKPGVLKVGLSLFEPTKELIEADVWDVSMDWGVTPRQVYEF